METQRVGACTLWEIRWHGRAGQGVKTVANLLAQAALREGKFAQSFPEFGPERRGAPVQAFNRLSDVPFSFHSGVTNPDIVLVLDARLMRTIPVTEGLKPEGWVIINTSLSPEGAQERWGLKPFRVATVDASRISRETLGRDIPNLPVLGALARVTELISLETLQIDVLQRFQRRFRERPEVIGPNLKALGRGFQEVRWTGSGPKVSGASVEKPSLPGWDELPVGGIISEPATSLRYRTGGWRLERPILDLGKCVQCLMCWMMCPDAAVIVRDGKVIGFDYEHCKGCGICASQCPPKAKAITMVPEDPFE